MPPHLYKRIQLWLGLLGTVLIVAAVLKSTGQDVSATTDLGRIFGPEVRTILIPVEFGVGLWLLSGVARRSAWLAALILFSSFALVSGFAGWQGAASCGCLGSARLHPWVICVFDVAVVLGLLFIRPRGNWEPADRFAVQLAGTTFLVLGLAGAVASWHFGSLAVAAGHLFARPVVALPAEIDLGTCAPDEEVETQVEFVNLTGTRVQAIMVRSDCRCVAAADMPAWIEAHGRATVSFRVRAPRDGGAFTRKLQWITSAGPLSGRVAGQVAGPSVAAKSAARQEGE